MLGEEAERPAGPSSSPDEAAGGSGRHAYLGEVDDVHGAGCGLGLAPGTKTKMSIYPSSCVVFPGDKIPILLPSGPACVLVDAILGAPKPFTRLFGMALFDLRRLSVTGSCTMVGTIVELIQFKAGDTGGDASLVVKAHQRFKFDPLAMFTRSDQDQMLYAVDLDRAGLLRCPVEVIGEDKICTLPRACLDKSAYWGRWAHRPFDIHLLAAKAAELYAKLGSRGFGQRDDVAIRSHASDPVQFSFWISSALPLGTREQQGLLECGRAWERLRIVIELLKDILEREVLCCAHCASPISLSRHIFRMTSEGQTGGVFVNPTGFLHDIVTVLEVDNAALQGEPEVAHSWFPGYAWTIAVCEDCGNHLGWKFTAAGGVERRPAAFWGLRNEAFAVSRTGNREAEASDDHAEPEREGRGLSGRVGAGLVRGFRSRPREDPAADDVDE